MLVSIIIPVYNEKGLIKDVLSEVRSSNIQPHEREILVVDDASTDGSAEILDEYAKESPIKVIHLPVNSGKASAIKAALKIANGDIILIQDADLEYSPHDYKIIFEPFSDPKVNAVYGSRFIENFWPENMKIQNWIANRIFIFLINLLYKAKITDEGTAYKAFRKDTLQSIPIKSCGFEFCPEVTAKLARQGIKIVEVPVSYKARSKKEGKKPEIIDGFKVLWTMIKYRFVK